MSFILHSLILLMQRNNFSERKYLGCGLSWNFVFFLCRNLITESSTQSYYSESVSSEIECLMETGITWSPFYRIIEKYMGRRLHSHSTTLRFMKKLPSTSLTRYGCYGCYGCYEHLELRPQPYTYTYPLFYFIYRKQVTVMITI